MTQPYVYDGINPPTTNNLVKRKKSVPGIFFVFVKLLFVFSSVYVETNLNPEI